LATPTPRSIIGQQRGFALTGSSADGTLASTVTLEVCADTGLLPTDKLCKHTAQRAFTAGQEPRAFCSQARHDARKITSHREERPITLSQHVK
jgi:hypothetical protein